MTNDQSVYLVYVMMLGKACPQKWYGSKFHGDKPVPVAYSHLLTEQERNLTLVDLCVKYPFEPRKEMKNEKIKIS